MNCNYKDKIMSYIEGELNESENKVFQSQLESNADLKREYNEINQIIKSLKKLPNIESSANFIVSLNKKIDDYEKSKGNSKWRLKGKNIFNVNYGPKISAIAAALCLLFVFTLTYFLSTGNYGNSSLMLMNSSATKDSTNNEVANIDSLNSDSIDR